MTVRLGTFDAERAWRPAELAQLPAVPGAAGHVESMDVLLACLCSPGDTLITRDPVDPVLREAMDEAGLRFGHLAAGSGGSVEEAVLRDAGALDLVRDNPFAPYAVTDAVAALADVSATRLPAVADVVRVNSKTWSNDLVAELGLAGAGTVVRSVAELEQAVAGAAGPVVVKDPYGVSGRGAVEIRSPGVLRAVTRVLARQDRRVELLVQPWYDKRHDLSAHGEVTPDGQWRPLGECVTHNRGFRYAGSGPLTAGLVADVAGWRRVIAEVAGRVAAEGYWGPVSIDAMVLADGTLVPVLEINARVSLGRLALELDRRLGDGDLRCHLWQIELAVPAGSGVGDLVRALAADGLLHRGGAGPGCVVLGGGVVAPPIGRVYCALRCAPSDLAGLRDRVLTSLAGVGLTPRGTIHAA